MSSCQCLCYPIQSKRDNVIIHASLHVIDYLIACIFLIIVAYLFTVYGTKNC